MLIKLDNLKISLMFKIRNLILKHRIAWLFFIIVAGVFCDQFSKIWVQKNLSQYYEISPGKIKHYSSEIVVLIPEIFNIIYVENDAAAFSLTSSIPNWFRKPFLIVVSFLSFLFFIIWYFLLKNPNIILMTSLSFILVGAIGNFIDRISLGYVIDFLDLYAGFWGYPNIHWPTFNIADSFIVIGVFGLILDIFLSKYKK